MHAIDEARMDAQDGGAREFMVSAFYPALANAKTENARFIDLFEPCTEEALAYITEGLDQADSVDLIPKLKSFGIRSFRDAAPERSGPFPVLIYYPGGGANRFASADVCEGLASFGYVVFAVDGPHDAELVVFPDGRLCKGPLKGDYISPGVGDVNYLISQLAQLTGAGFLAGMIDPERVGIFGHSRGGYIANITAFMNDCIRAAVSIDSFLWGYATKGTGLERHSKELQKKVKSTAKPILRMCGRPAGADPQTEAEFCLARDGGDFIGEFTVAAFPGWSHGDFETTPWLCGKGEKLLKNQAPRRQGAAHTLTDILKAFFAVHLLGASRDSFVSAMKSYPEVGVATAARSC